MLKGFTQYARRGLILRQYQPVVHPLSLTTRGDNSGATQVSKMSRNFGLIDVQNLDEVANTDLAISN